ncbi:disrupted in renal carcinoma protein 1 [Carlito syrichta]|uniref:Disrupted in renal carcinoma protein 1 n=1 Tax=Carlito syrichta TaxID=1868482 RepID=A0A1U7SQG1_CARSF|nr:disrupted in renal carcinoma protein 1 [Carlito syrichta]
MQRSSLTTHPDKCLRPSCRLQTSLLTTDHGSRRSVSCYLPPYNTYPHVCTDPECLGFFSCCNIGAELYITSDTHFCKPRTKDQLSSRSQLNTVRLMCSNSFRE